TPDRLPPPLRFTAARPQYPPIMHDAMQIGEIHTTVAFTRCPRRARICETLSLAAGLSRSRIMSERKTARGFFEFLVTSEIARLVIDSAKVAALGPFAAVVPVAGRAIEYFGPAVIRRMWL